MHDAIESRWKQCTCQRETVANMDTARKKLLERLRDLTAPVAETLNALSRFGWDSEEALVTVEPHHVEAVLRRFLAGEIGAAVVEDWANGLEARDDVALADDDDGTLSEVLFDLANPTLQGPLTGEFARSLIARFNNR